jgi:carbon storage regulator CsrA
MLIISRKKDHRIVVAEEIEITILEVGRNRVRFGIKAPKHIPIQTRLKGNEEPVGVAAEVTKSRPDYSHSQTVPETPVGQNQ